MSTAFVDRSMHLGPRLLTVADLAAMPSELPSGPVKYELDDGRLVLITPPGWSHGSLQATIVHFLKVQGQMKGHGKALGELTVVLRRKPDRIVAPDAAFVTKRSLPVRTSREDYVETIPELVVEVRSKNDRRSELRAKAEEYLRAGVQIVWVIDPSAKIVTIYRQGESPHVLQEDDVLTAKGVIPGFKVPVADLFEA
jgi:Uma2 family endonuclease